MISENIATSTKQQKERRILFRKLLCSAAAKAVKQGDPWAKHNIPSIPAERVIRRLYDVTSKQWIVDETIVKMEKTPFTHGAMRFCFRMKMMTPPPSANNDKGISSCHRFTSIGGWKQASNYVAKSYMTTSGQMDTSPKAKQDIQNDIVLQYEAQHHAEVYNQSNPPKSIVFILAYLIEFPDREGQPQMAIERYISGKGSYGAGFIKHNTNSGYVNEELHRLTPQLFSAYSFWKSNGERLVADIQGVGDLYTDPQVLSSDYRFGAGDLGPRGMALFFKTFRHSRASDAMGIPTFELSRWEVKKEMSRTNINDNDDDEEEEEEEDEDDNNNNNNNNKDTVVNDSDDDRFHQQFSVRDVNKQMRSLLLNTQQQQQVQEQFQQKRDLLSPQQPPVVAKTVKTSNLAKISESV